MRRIGALIVLLITLSCSTDEIVIKPLSAYIPQDTKCILKVNDIKAGIDTLSTNELMKVEKGMQFVHYLDSLLLTNHTQLKKGILCVSESETDGYAYTWLSKQVLDPNAIAAFKKIKPSEDDPSAIPVYSVTKGLDQLFLTNMDSLLITSSSPKIIKNISSRKENPLLKNESFTKAYASASTNTPVSLVINTAHLPTSQRFVQPHTVDTISQIKGWVTAHLETKKNSTLVEASLMKNTTIKNNILDIFKNTTPRPSNVFKILPFDTQSVVSYTYNNYTILKENIAQLQESQSVFRPYTLDYILNDCYEISLVSQENEDVIVLTSNDTYTISEKLNKKKLLSYSNIGIYQFEEPDAFSVVLAPLIKKTKVNCYFIYDNFIVFARNPIVLKNILINIRNRNLLKNQNWYQELIKQQLPVASVSYFNL